MKPSALKFKPPGISPVVPVVRAPDSRNNIRYSHAEASTSSVMIGLGETCITTLIPPRFQNPFMSPDHRSAHTRCIGSSAQARTAKNPTDSPNPTAPRRYWSDGQLIGSDRDVSMVGDPRFDRQNAGGSAERPWSDKRFTKNWQIESFWVIPPGYLSCFSRKCGRDSLSTECAHCWSST